TPDVKVKDAKEKYFHLIVLVQNKEGYQNLCRLLAYSYQEGFYFKPRIDYRALEMYNKGLFITTACVGGHIPTLLRHDRDEEAIKWMKWNLDVFGKDRFFFEMAPPDIEKQAILNKKLKKYSAEMGIGCVITGDAHYLCEEDHEAHEVLLSIQTKHLLTDEKRMTFGDFRGHVKSTQYMLDTFPDHHDAVWRTGEIADRCEFDFETDKLFFPKYPIPKEHTEDSFFEHLCKEGLENIKKNDLIPAENHAAYDTRLQEEVDLIIKMGYVGYFLITSDFIRWAKENNIAVGPGRGSAAGSLVAWAMQITNVDPVKYNLLFERFLNPERVSMPDIDIDFCVERREDVITYVKDKYGHDAVCQIITFGTMMAKGVIKDVARVLGFPFQDANNLTNLVPDQLKITLKECLEQEPKFQEMMDSDPEVKRLMDICFRLEGLTRHASKHAAGVVISPEPLRDVLPLYVPSKTTELVTQYAMTELETLGYLKMDFLGLTNLTVIEYALKAIEKNHGKLINLDKLPLDDPKTFALLANGKTSCVFQFESSGIKEVLYKLQPTRFEDLIAVNALYRPGPLGSGMVDDFIDRRHGRKKTTYLFKELEPILSETYGVIVYQEQVMKIASAVAGYSLGGADILRRAMGKKKVEVMAEQKKKFLCGSKERGFDEKKAGELFDLMAYFAGYGFNKSHSTAYALIAYHTAYLKANYPIEFMAAVLTFETNNPDKLRFYLQEVREMGIQIFPPDINRSDASFTATEKGIVFGLKGIKNVGGAALDAILAERDGTDISPGKDPGPSNAGSPLKAGKDQNSSSRTERQPNPFKDLYDFCLRLDLRTVNKRVLESLICAGAFDTLPGYRSQKMDELEKVMAQAHDEKERSKTGQMDLFGGGAPEQKQKVYAFSPQSEWSSQEKLSKEKEMVGFYLSDHPLHTYRHLIEPLKPSLFKDLLADAQDKKFTAEPVVTVCGLLQSKKVIMTKKGDKMAFAQFEDLSGTAEVVIFPRTFKQAEMLLEGFNEFVVTGSLDIANTQSCKIKANEIIPLEQLCDRDMITHAILTLPPTVSAERIEELKELIPAGKISFQLQFKENDQTLVLTPRSKASVSAELLKKLRSWDIGVQLELKG
ncbi:MAG: DNA polymerase III subunit alpha, partial [Candidatus Dependentiae bacterium]